MVTRVPFGTARAAAIVSASSGGLLVGRGEAAPHWGALAIRYTVGSVSLLLGGLGFWWAWIDRDRLTWHDRASGTRMVRLAKRAK